MAESKDKRKDPNQPVGPDPGERPSGTSGSSLFSQTGPVRMASSKKETMALGDIGRSEYTPSPPAYESPTPVPEMPLPPPILESVPETSIPSIHPREKTLNARIPSSPTSWSSLKAQPDIQTSAFVHPGAVIMGNVILKERVTVAPGAVVRADNDEPIYVGAESNIQEGAVLKDLPTKIDRVSISQRVVEVSGEKFSLYVNNRVSIGAQAQVHGPAYIGERVYIGMQSLVFWARIENDVVIEPGCLVMNVTVPSGVFIPAGLKVTNQAMVRDLPPLTSKYRFHGICEETVKANLEMLDGYRSVYH
ncbi:hypothetical protein KAU08_00890 [bacterium]|nr:hypothetical protein [bacterium]